MIFFLLRSDELCRVAANIPKSSKLNLRQRVRVLTLAFTFAIYAFIFRQQQSLTDFRTWSGEPENSSIDRIINGPAAMDYQRVSLPDVHTHTYPRRTREIPDARMIFKYIRTIPPPPDRQSVRLSIMFRYRNGSGTIQSRVDLSRDGLSLRDLFFYFSRIGCFVHYAQRCLNNNLNLSNTLSMTCVRVFIDKWTRNTYNAYIHIYTM